MTAILRAAALALILALSPACSALHVPLANPFAAARTIDQQAYALIGTYADVLEEAAKIVANPAAPAALKQALGKAEALATPSVETLEIAVIAYLGAKADAEAIAAAGSPTAKTAAAALRAAADRAAAAITAAQTPIRALQDALKN